MLPSLAEATLLDRIAIHESGHSVVAVILDLCVGDVTIVPSGNVLGRAGIGTPMQTASYWANKLVPTASVAVKTAHAWHLLETAAQSVIMAQAAGHESDLVFFGSAIDGADAADRAVIENHVRRFQLDEAHWRKATRRLVRKHRSVIERVAAALIEHRTLTVEQVDGLIA